MINHINSTSSNLVINEAESGDLQSLLELYTHLHDNPLPVINEDIEKIWKRIIADANHHILIGYLDKKAVASCVVLIVENLTHRQRPYAVIENVITHPDYRQRGYATSVLLAAKDISVRRGCYKMMLMTGSKQESTFNFYRRAGFNSTDKTAFVQWL